MKTEIFGINAKKKSEIELKDSIFSVKPNLNTVYEGVKNQLANKRQGTADTKTRGTVNGSTRKPWRQKGTGRARAGTAKSPLWRGKGIIFGPHPRDYSYKIPKKVKQNALFSILSSAKKDGKVTVLEEFKQETFKTKEINNLLVNLLKEKKLFDFKKQIPRKVLLILNSDEKENYFKIKKSGGNIKWLRVVNVKSLELKDLAYSEHLIWGEKAITEINSRYN